MTNTQDASRYRKRPVVVEARQGRKREFKIQSILPKEVDDKLHDEQRTKAQNKS